MSPDRAPAALTVDDLAAMMADWDRTGDQWRASFQNVLMSRSAEIGETLEDRKRLAERIWAAYERVTDADITGGSA